jgi:hypothetical protein
MTHKSKNVFVKVHVFKCWMVSFERAEGFFCVTWTFFMEA